MHWNKTFSYNVFIERNLTPFLPFFIISQTNLKNSHDSDSSWNPSDENDLEPKLESDFSEEDDDLDEEYYDYSQDDSGKQKEDSSQEGNDELFD